MQSQFKVAVSIFLLFLIGIPSVALAMLSWPEEILSISEIHQPFNTFEKYAKEISDGKYEYHPQRQELHQAIIEPRLLEGTQALQPERPLVIFTAGPYGAGKSVVLQSLNRANLLNTHDFLIIDPDEYKKEIPEYRRFQELGSENAATLVHKESGYIQELILEQALKLRKNIIVDGSLKDKEWFSQEFRRIKEDYPDYIISIIYVTADQSLLTERVEKRGNGQFGRKIKPEDVIASSVQVADSIETLRALSDFTIRISNQTSPRIVSYFKEGHETFVRQEVPLKDSLQEILGVNFPSIEMDRENVRHYSPRMRRLYTNKLSLRKNEISVEELSKIALGRQVIYLGGYTDIGYNNRDWIKNYLAQLMVQYGSKTVYVIPNHSRGMGEAWHWIPELADKLHLEQVETAFIQSKEKRSECGDEQSARRNVDYVIFSNLNPWELPSVPQKINLLKQLNAKMIYLKGDESSLEEILQASRQGLNVTLVRDQNIQPNSELVAQKLFRDYSFSVDPTEDLEANLHRDELSLSAISHFEGKQPLKLTILKEVTHPFHLDTHPPLSPDLKAWLRESLDEVGALPQSLNLSYETLSRDENALPLLGFGAMITSYPEIRNLCFHENHIKNWDQLDIDQCDHLVQSILFSKSLVEYPYDQVKEGYPREFPLSKDQYEAIQKLLASAIRTPEDIQAMAALFILENVKKLQNLNALNFVKWVKASHNFPTFDNLDLSRRSMIENLLIHEIHLENLIQGEFEIFVSDRVELRSKEAIRFSIAASLLKMMSSFIIKTSSSPLPPLDIRSYPLLKEAIKFYFNLLNKTPLKEAYFKFLQGQGKVLGISVPDSESQTSEIALAAIRLCLIMRVYDPEQAMLMYIDLKSMPEDKRNYLVDKLMRWEKSGLKLIPSEEMNKWMVNHLLLSHPILVDRSFRFLLDL